MFRKIDLKLGYWQVQIRPGDIPKTTLKMWWGLYEYLVMPFGIINGPVQFMGIMNDLLVEYLNKFVLIFLDDMVVYSCNVQENAEHLRKVLGKLENISYLQKRPSVSSQIHQSCSLDNRSHVVEWRLQRQS